MKYTIDLRNDVYFHDGHKVDAYDVQFTFRAHLTPKVQSSYYMDLKSIFGSDSDGASHGNGSFTILDVNGDDHFERIEFNFKVAHIPFLTDYLGLDIYPEHILGDPTSHGTSERWQVTPTNWITHSMNTADQTDLGGFKGPIGCGSMIFYGYDSTSKVVTLKKWDGYQWDHITKTWEIGTDAGYQHFLAVDGTLDDMPAMFKIVPALMERAIEDLKTGKMNVMDPQYTMTNIMSELQVEPSIQTILLPENSWTALFLNPKFVQDDTYHLNKKGVRHAISHIIPRENITANYMGGLAWPAYTPLPSNSWAAIPEIELTNYKRELTATDNSQPLAKELTAYDSFSYRIALDWLESEGYDVTYYRKQLGLPLPLNSFIAELFSTYPNLIFGVSLLTGIVLTFLIKWVGPKIFQKRK